MDQSQQVFFLVFLGALGLAWGSFANVVIWRFPRDEALARPSSHCPVCGHPIRWHDNIPLLSWVLLRARCRDCGTRIPLRYPLVEALSGALWVGAGSVFGFSFKTIVAIAFLYLLLILAMIDLDTMRLPNAIVLVMVFVGLAAAVVSQLTSLDLGPLLGSIDLGRWAGPLATAATGAALGVVPTFAIAAAYAAVRGTPGLGMGDVKLLGAMGLFLGPYVLFALVTGSILGTLVGVPMAMARKDPDEDVARARIPFGPFLALGGVVAALWGQAMTGWYLSLVGGA